MIFVIVIIVGLCSYDAGQKSTEKKLQGELADLCEEQD